MPPQIVGADADAETFVIGDDDVDPEDEGFEYVHDVEMTPESSNSASPSTGHAGLRGTGMGSPSWDGPGPPALSGPVE